MTVGAGTRLGHYTILAGIGAGGMGEVWLAEDATLKRNVALKVLPAAKATDPDRLARFQREAEAIAALHHPNIVTIYSVEQDGEVRFLTMEYVEGQRLDEVIPRGGLPVAQMLDVGAILADALAASHDAGIIHRDIKPANIMFTRDRRVKVLDFGLAKLREGAAADAETETGHVTSEGRVLGTVPYMSPEQAEGRPVDARSDLFSLGIVLFEMATGERPFKGDSDLSILSAILRDTPKAVTDVRPDLPSEFARILKRCLQKDCEDRYQTAKDVRSDLRVLKADIELPGIKSASGITQTPTPGRPLRLRRTLGAGALAVLLLLSLIVVFSRNSPAFFGLGRRPFESFQLRQLTNSGKVGEGVAISPDGRYVAYVVNDADHRSLWLRQVATGADAQIVRSDDIVEICDPAFSRDGNFVLYSARTRVGESGWALYSVATLGGAARRVFDGDVSLSPDGKHLAFVRKENGGSGLLVSNEYGVDERHLVTRTDLNWKPAAPTTANLSFTKSDLPTWSPDSRSLATWIWRPVFTGILLVDVQTGQARTIGQAHLNLGTYSRLTWLPDGSGFLVVATAFGDPSAQRDQIWFIPYARSLPQATHLNPLERVAGEPLQLTHDLNRYEALSVTADGRTIAASQGFERSTLWMASPDNPTSEPRQITSLTVREGEPDIDWTRDGRLVFVKDHDLWSMEVDGTGQRQLTHNAQTPRRPVVSPNGRVIVFFSTDYALGRGSLWRLDIDGSRPQLLTGLNGSGYLELGFTSDGASFIYSEGTDPKEQRWRKVPVNGGEPVLIDEHEALSSTARATVSPQGFRPEVTSPDGAWAAGWYADSVSGRSRFAVVGADGTRARREYKNVPPAAGNFAWIRDGRALAYVVEDPSSHVLTVWAQALDGAPPKALMSVNGSRRWLKWSPDGEYLVFTRDEATRDIVLITNEVKK